MSRQSEGQGSRVGRPSLAADRRSEALSAFVDLIAERGLEGVTLDDVAAAAGMQRSVVRHYVGNRTDLVRAAVDVLTQRYADLVRAAVGDAPTVDRALDVLFSDSWISEMDNEDRALDVLLQEAVRDSVTRERIKAMYELLVGELARLIGGEQPSISTTAARHAAYLIVCLAEHNVTMQHLGFPATHSRAARRQAGRIVEQLA